MSEKILKSVQNPSKRTDNSYLNDFFGLSSKPTEIKIESVENKKTLDSIPFTSFITYKRNTIEELEKLMDYNFTKGNSENTSSCFKRNTLLTYVEEWADIKQTTNISLFNHPKTNQNHFTWINNNKNNEISNMFKTTQAQIQSYIKLINHTKIDENLDLFDLLHLDELDVPLAQKSVLQCVVNLINHLTDAKLNRSLRASAEYNISIIDFAIAYLGKSFKNYIKIFIERSDPSQKVASSISNGIDVPSIRMISVLYKLTVRNEYQNSQESINGVSIWFLLYNLIRIQDYQTAIDISRNLSPIYKIFTIILNHICQNTAISLSQIELEQFHRLSSVRLKENSDAYEKLLLSLFTFQNMDSDSLNPIETIEEYVWFKTLRLKLSHLLNPSAIPDPLLKLDEELITDFENFDKNMKPSFFSQSFCLFIIGSFEKAICTLGKDEIGIIYAIFCSILLWKFNLLNVTLKSNKNIVIEKIKENKKKITLNLAPLLSQYFMRIPFSNEIFMVDYFIALQGVKSKTTDMVTFGAQYLIKKFGQFERLIVHGWLNGDHKQTYDNSSVTLYSDDYDKCVGCLAKYCKSIYENLIALALYMSINDYNSATDCMIEILIDLISQPNSYSSDTMTDVLTQGKYLGDMILTKPAINIVNSESLFLLLDLCLFFKEFWAKRYNSAFKIIKALSLVPTNTREIEECLLRLQKYPRKFKLIVKDILYATSIIIHKIHDQCKYEAAKIDPAMINSMREQSAAILSFASRLPYNLPHGLVTKLIAELSEIRK